ncbi:hypothetical protein VNO80_18175 [Phaseolus coccineus]|uniref:Uncharacterized protein n=1 Tax=Phaseolus coccineus TaxID=3886 RepID=A0AAN9MIV6_PHACN
MVLCILNLEQETGDFRLTTQQYQALPEILKQSTNGTVASQAQVNHVGTLTMEPSHKAAAQSPTALTVWLGVETGAAALPRLDEGVSSFHAALTVLLGVETGDVALPRLVFCSIFHAALTVLLGVETGDVSLLRLGEGVVHLAPGSKFNFQKYIKRSLEDDFKVVVGLSPVLWASFVVFLLLNVNGLHAMFWASLIPVVIILAVGTKLQLALAKMAIEITERHAVVQGIALVQGSDRYFWFGRPQLVILSILLCFSESSIRLWQGWSGKHLHKAMYVTDVRCLETLFSIALLMVTQTMT